MSARGKGRRASKYAKSGKYSKQFARTVRKTGKWRGVIADLYKKYIKKNKKGIIICH